MKKTITILVAFLLTVNYSCKEKIDYEKEREAIVAAAEEETSAYYASDFDRWAANYIQDSTLIVTGVSKSGPYYSSGWKAYSSDFKSAIVNKKDLQKEVKTPLRIKVYGESAWIVLDNESFNNKGESTGKTTVIQFLEKHEGKWKIVYRSVIQDDSYYQPDFFALISLDYTKLLGKKVEDFATLVGDQLKTSWNKADGYNGLVNGMLYAWGILVPKKELKIIEQDTNHIVFNVNKLFTGLKTAPQYNVTYDDYLTMYKIICQKIADYMGSTYKQEATTDGLRISLSKK